MVELYCPRCCLVDDYKQPRFCPICKMEMETSPRANINYGKIMVASGVKK